MEPDIQIAGSGNVPASPGPVSEVLDRASLSARADHVTVIASDGYRASIPLGVLTSGGVLSVENDAWRLTVIDGSTLCWNVKDVVRLEPTVGKADDDVPERPTH